MSFNQGASSGSLSFRPARYDIEWDGVSEAKASFELACGGTGVSYAAKAYRVFPETGDNNCISTNNSDAGNYVKGDRFWSWDLNALPNNCVKLFAGDITLPATVSSNVATIIFSSITATTHAYAWQLTATKGTATRVVAAGKLEAVGLNPYAPGAGRISLVSGVTASGCL